MTSIYPTAEVHKCGASKTVRDSYVILGIEDVVQELKVIQPNQWGECMRTQTAILLGR